MSDIEQGGKVADFIARLEIPYRRGRAIEALVAGDTDMAMALLGGNGPTADRPKSAVIARNLAKPAKRRKSKAAASTNGKGPGARECVKCGKIKGVTGFPAGGGTICHMCLRPGSDGRAKSLAETE